jgi:hypothetical protein
MREIPSTIFLHIRPFSRFGVGGGNCINIDGEDGGPFEPSNWNKITGVGREECIWGISLRWVWEKQFRMAGDGLI